MTKVLLVVATCVFLVGPAPSAAQLSIGGGAARALDNDWWIRVTSQRPRESVVSHLVGAFDGFEYGRVYRLDNGQIWEQTSTDFVYRYAYRPEVLIYKSAAGPIRMLVDALENRSAVVERLK